MTAIGAKYPGAQDCRVSAISGARGTAYWNVRLLDSLFDFDEIRVHSRRPESRDAFGAPPERRPEQDGDRHRHLEGCLDGADILVEASRLPAPEPLFLTEWVKEGAFVVPSAR